MYDKAGAVGVNGALLNSDSKVINADKFLIVYNLANFASPGTTYVDRARSFATAGAFIPIVLVKTLMHGVKSHWNLMKAQTLILTAPFFYKIRDL